MRGWLVIIAAGCAVAACSFPDVEYTDGGAGTTSSAGGGGSGGACPVPSNCAGTAMNCADQAGHKDWSCRKSCQNNASCLGQCDAAMQSLLAACESDCEDCGAATCGAQPTNCQALVGL